MVACLTSRVNFHDDAIDSIELTMPAIEAQLVLDVTQHENARPNTDRESQDVDERVDFVAQHVAEGCLEIIFNH